MKLNLPTDIAVTSDIVIRSVMPVQVPYVNPEPWQPKYFWRVEVFGVRVGKFRRYSRANSAAASIRYGLLNFISGLKQ